MNETLLAFKNQTGSLARQKCHRFVQGVLSFF
jgi:hypothetical protein